MGIPGEGGTLSPIPCEDEKATRAKIADRYFRPGTELDLYVRGAPTGSFTVAAEESEEVGCQPRASGRRHGAPGSTYDFIALYPDDAVKLGPIHFPMKPQPDARAVVRLALGDKAPGTLSLRSVRRMTDGSQQILVADVALGSGGHAVVIAEGAGTDPTGWKAVWSDLTDGSQPALLLVDAFDLGADGHPKVLLERPKRGGATEWILLRRDAKGWR